MVIEAVTVQSDEPQLLPASKNVSEGQSDHKDARAVISRAIDSVPGRNSALVVEVGTGKDLPPEINGFRNIYLNDNDPTMFSAARKSLGADNGILNDVAGDMLGFLPDINKYLQAINSDSTEAELVQGLRRLKRVRNAGLTSMPLADLTVSSMALPRFWEEPLLLLRGELQRKLGAANSGKLIGILDEIDSELKYGLFLDHIRMLRQKTILGGVIVLITPIRDITAGGNKPVLPAGAEGYLNRVSKSSKERFGDDAVSEWRWSNDGKEYIVKGYLIDPDADPDATD